MIMARQCTVSGSVTLAKVRNPCLFAITRILTSRFRQLGVTRGLLSSSGHVQADHRLFPHKFSLRNAGYFRRGRPECHSRLLPLI